jgi:hypothetical protein
VHQLLSVQSNFFSGPFIEAPKVGSSVTVATRVSQFLHTLNFAGNPTSARFRCQRDDACNLPGVQYLVKSPDFPGIHPGTTGTD